MKTTSIALVVLLAGADCALAQADLPGKMQGSWRSGTKGGESIIELIGMVSPDKAKVKVTMSGAFAPPHGNTCIFGTVESVAERQGEAWQINASHMRCVSYFITIKPVDGRQRYEGTLSNDFSGTPGTIFYEW